MFVMFIPSKQFEEGWWTQVCAEHITLTNPRPQFATTTKSLYLQKSPENVGVDLNAARQLCTKYGPKVNPVDNGSAPTTAASGGQRKTQAEDASAASTDQVATVLSVTPVHYRKWSPIALAIFRELAWAVVAGTHIQEVQNQSVITQLNCPANDVGNIIFDKTGTLSCEVTGEGLDKVATLRLRNAQDATDTDTADGPVTVSGDATKAKVTFQLSKLGGLNKPAYKVYTVTTTGVEAFANQTIHFDLNPFVTDLSPTTADPGKQSSMVFTLKGFHLDKVVKVQLFEGTYKSGTTSLLQYDLDSGGTATQVAFTVKGTDDDLKKKASEALGEVLAVELSVKNSSSGPVVGGSITLKSTSEESTVAFSPKALTFGAQKEKTTSSGKTLKLTNSVSVPMTDLTVKIAGANSNNFSETDTCGKSVAAGANCVFTLKFAPTSSGKLAATLSLTYTVGGAQQSQSVSLAGTGTK